MRFHRIRRNRFEQFPGSSKLLTFVLNRHPVFQCGGDGIREIIMAVAGFSGGLLTEFCQQTLPCIIQLCLCDRLYRQALNLCPQQGDAAEIIPALRMHYHQLLKTAAVQHSPPAG